MLANNPDYAFTPAFSAIVGTHIGSSNKFVLMDEQGRQAVVNQTSGVYWSGLWLSNTYAWTASPSASKTPAKKSKKAQAQAIKQSKELPESRLPVAYSTGYGVGSGSVYNSREYYYPDYYDLENTLDDLAVMGFEDASKISTRKLDAFVDVFGVNAFLDLAEMLMSGEINEEWFIEGITDHKCARVDFALKPYNSYSEV